MRDIKLNAIRRNKGSTVKAILFNDTSYEKHFGSQLVVQQIYSLAENAGIEIIRACPMRHNWHTDEHLKNEIKSVDLCLINGEGTIHHNQKQARLLLELAPYCHEHGTPCFLINSLWIANGDLVDMARQLTGIYVRDKQSQRELLSSGIASNVVPDLTLTAEVRANIKSARAGYLINGNVLPDREYEAWNSYANSGCEDLDFISIKALPILQKNKGSTALLIKSIIHRARSKIDRRIAILNKKSPTLNHLRWQHSATSLDSFLEKISSSEGVITGRFHCATLCLLTKTPVFAIPSNTPKIEELFSQANIENRIFSNYTEAINKRNEIGFSADEMLNINNFLENTKLEATKMFTNIAESTKKAKY